MKKAMILTSKLTVALIHKTIKACYDAGANVFVAGSYLFKASDLAAQVETLRVALDD